MYQNSWTQTGNEFHTQKHGKSSVSVYVREHSVFEVQSPRSPDLITLIFNLRGP